MVSGPLCPVRPVSYDYSVVIPVFNEGESLPAVIQQVMAVMNTMTTSWELICVDDGSTDNTAAVLAAHNNVVGIVRKRNGGQSAALADGFHRACGEVVITLDGDGQNDPTDIPKLVATLHEGYHLVCGYRTVRQDRWLRRAISRLANSVRGQLCQDGVRDTGCALKAFKRSCLPHIPLFDGMHRFLSALFLRAGYRVHEVPVNHRPRNAGVSKYPFHRRALKPIVDLLGMLWLQRRALIRGSHDS